MYQELLERSLYKREARVGPGRAVSGRHQVVVFQSGKLTFQRVINGVLLWIILQRLVLNTHPILSDPHYRPYTECPRNVHNRTVCTNVNFTEIARYKFDPGSSLRCVLFKTRMILLLYKGLHRQVNVRSTHLWNSCLWSSG